MPIVCPTVLAENPHSYREQVERVQLFAKRMHLDFADGIFTPSRTIDLDQAWLPDNLEVDLHVMHIAPGMEAKQLVNLKANMVIVHAEAEGNFVLLADKLHEAGMKVGVALLQNTPVKKVKKAISHIDHVLIFSGDLGHFGGEADLELLKKVKDVRKMKSSIEIGWDGGINDTNIAEIAEAGVDVLNVGGYIQRAPDPRAAFERLQSLIH